MELTDLTDALTFIPSVVEPLPLQTILSPYKSTVGKTIHISLPSFQPQVFSSAPSMGTLRVEKMG